jgi:hypothetical protein
LHALVYTLKGNFRSDIIKVYSSKLNYVVYSNINVVKYPVVQFFRAAIHEYTSDEKILRMTKPSKTMFALINTSMNNCMLLTIQLV